MQLCCATTSGCLKFDSCACPARPWPCRLWCILAHTRARGIGAAAASTCAHSNGPSAAPDAACARSQPLTPRIAFSAAGAPRTAAQIGAAVATGGAIAAGTTKLRQKRGAGAGVEVWNTLVDADGPTDFDPQALAPIRGRFGDAPEVVEGIKQAYFSYLLVRPPHAACRRARMAA
jgi:hypothetical protein